MKNEEIVNKFSAKHFVKDFVDAMYNDDEAAVKELSDTYSSDKELSIKDSIEVAEGILEECSKREASTEELKEKIDNFLEHLSQVLAMLKMRLLIDELDEEAKSEEDYENSSSDAAKEIEEDYEGKEVTEEVTAVASADEVQETNASEPESGGYAPAEEQKEEKSEAQS